MQQILINKTKHHEHIGQLEDEIRRVQERIEAVGSENMVIKEELMDLSFVS
jgi:hypothetical protein